MSSARHPESIQIGLVSDEPIRLEGLISIFDQQAGNGNASLLPVTGSLTEMLARPTLEYLLVDMHASANGLAALESIRRARPGLRLIVIGPEGNDELVMESSFAAVRELFWERVRAIGLGTLDGAARLARPVFAVSSGGNSTISSAS